MGPVLPAVPTWVPEDLQACVLSTQFVEGCCCIGTHSSCKTGLDLAWHWQACKHHDDSTLCCTVCNLCIAHGCGPQSGKQPRRCVTPEAVVPRGTQEGRQQMQSPRAPSKWGQRGRHKTNGESLKTRCHKPNKLLYNATCRGPNAKTHNRGGKTTDGSQISYFLRALPCFFPCHACQPSS